MADLLIVNNLELRPSDMQYRFDLIEGWDEWPEFDGENTVIVGKPGELDEIFISRRRILKFDGWIHGLGDTIAERKTDYLDAVQAFTTAIAPRTAGLLGGPVTVELHGPYGGIASGDTWMIDAKYSGSMWSPPIGGRISRHLVFSMVCVDDPPEWVVTS